MRGNATVTYVKVTESRDPYGNVARTEADPVPVPGAVWAPRTSTERTNPGEPAVITGGSLFQVPTQLDVGPLDYFTVNTIRYDVTGEPGRWVSPFTGRDFGYEVAVLRYEQT